MAAGDVQDLEGSAFRGQVRDVVGLYLDPPEGEVVLVDAKTGIQALDRTQPLLPIDFGKTQKRTFDYARMGTTDLYAAMDIRTGNVITSLSQTHATPDFLRLVKKVVSAYPGQKVHVVLDNASVHLSSDTEKLLAKQNGEVVFHFTPPGASWMNRIEIWNGIIARKLIRRGTFKSVKALNRDIEVFVKQWNSDCKPITWTATVEEISTRSVLSRPTWTLSCVPPRLTMWPVGQRK
ncbi:MAG: IS630 family transposase [Pseudonocardiaceae bacterium]